MRSKRHEFNYESSYSRYKMTMQTIRNVINAKGVCCLLVVSQQNGATDRVRDFLTEMAESGIS